MTTGRPKGGFRRPVKLSTWIRDKLAGGATYHAYGLYGDYVNEVGSIPLSRNRGKRHVIGYRGFVSSYLYVLRQLGLIEYVTDEQGNVLEEEALDKGGNPAPYLAKRRYFRAVASRLSDPAWENIWEAYRR